MAKGWKFSIPEMPPYRRWIMVINDDRAGAELWSWYHDENGNGGWHNSVGAFDGDQAFCDPQWWCLMPKGFKAWVDTASDEEWRAHYRP